MEPWLSWGIALIFGGLAFYYYNFQKKPQVNKTRASSVSESLPAAVKPIRRRDENKAKPKAQPQTGSSSAIDVAPLNNESRNGDVAKKPKPAKMVPTPSIGAPVAIARTAAPVPDDLAEQEDNKQWAQQLLSLKKGTTLAAPVRNDSRNKTVKQSAASLTSNLSSASSNAADADDDWTPVRSPALAAGDVSDMLEPTPGGPSVLRLTESAKPVKSKQQRQAPLEVVNSKKQRQNRKKVEERRLQREAEEKERQVLLETQRRVARESRGEPARNGVTISKPPAVSEWAVKAAVRATQPSVIAVSGGAADSTALLDTFDQRKELATSLPSEEDQMTMAKKMSEDESGWNTVPKGKKQKKTQATGLAESNGSDNVAEPSVSYVQSRVPAPTTKVASAPVSNPVETYTNGYTSTASNPFDAGSHPEDSTWSA